MLLFSIMTPLGTFLANTIEALATYATYLNALVIGVFLHISTVILFESSEGHKFNLRKLVGHCFWGSNCLFFVNV